MRCFELKEHSHIAPPSAEFIIIKSLASYLAASELCPELIPRQVYWTVFVGTPESCSFL